MNIKNIISSAMLAGTLFTSVSLASPTDKIYATVNGDAIKASDIAVMLKDPKINFDMLPQKNKKEVLDQLINKKLLASKALNSDVINEAVYKTTLKNSIVALKENLALQMWIAKISKDINPSENEIKSFFEKNKANFKKPKKYKANHILLKTEKEAKDIIASLEKSKNLKADFIQLAKEKSTGPSGKNGGDLGWFEANKMVPEFSLATSFLKKGTITKNPVKTQFGYHVIYLDDIQNESLASFDEVKNDIKRLLSQEQFNKKLEAIINKEKSTAKIIIK